MNSNSNKKQTKIFTGSSSVDFVNNMCRFLNISAGKSVTYHFPESNIYVKILENVRNKDIFLVQTIGLDANNSFMELLFLIDSFKRSSAKSVTVIMPCFSYAKADKKDEPRVSIRARVCADCIEAAGADRVIAVDLHSPQIQGFFKKPVDHLYAYPLICEYIKTVNIADLVIVSPDIGFAKSARRYASYLNIQTIICDKTRKEDTGKARIIEMFGNIENKNALIVDDFAITCGTLIEAAEVLKHNGAKRIFAVVTHALMNKKAVKELEKSHIERLIVTDTVNNPLVLNNQKIKVISVAPLIAEAVRIIEEEGSLSLLFDHPQKDIKGSCW